MRRVIAAIAAVLLAVIGALLIINYVNRADDRALEGLKAATVLVVTAPISAGTTAEVVANAVRSEELPSMAVAPGALSDLEEVAGQVTTTDLVEGEQLIAARFTDPEATAGDGVPLPDGLQAVSVLLQSERVIGGRLRPGQHVGVVISYAPPLRVYESKVVLNRVLVTQVDGAPSDEGDEGTSEGAASGSIMVTFALNTPDSERLVHGAEFGTVWLTLQPDAADLTGSRIVTPENVYE